VSDERQLKVSYDVSNAFFRLILDETMTYSCALFDHRGEPLELAQRRKLAWLSDAAAVLPGMRVLDIGCGWGGVLAYLVEERGVREARGITLSTAQYEYCAAERMPGAAVELVSYLLLRFLREGHVGFPHERAEAHRLRSLRVQLRARGRARG